MNETGKRIQRLRKALKLTQADVAKFIGINRVSVSQWESQGDSPSKPTGENLIKLCQILRANPNYILFGESINTVGEAVVSYDYNAPLMAKDTSTEYDSTKVPIITWEELHEEHFKKKPKLSKKTDNTQKGPQRYIDCYKKHSERSYALEITSSAMTAPVGNKYTFPEGFVIVVDPNHHSFEDGTFAMVTLNKISSVMFRQIKKDGSLLYLNALNPEYPKIFETFWHLGSVIDLIAPDLPK